jgi:glycosyltransferase involved in cell wall biosynthesis
MRIAVDGLSAKSLYHGMGIYTFNLLKELAPIAHEHNILIYNNSNIFFNISKENNNVEIRNITKHRYFRIAWEYTSLPISLKREKVDIFWGPSNFLPPIKPCKFIVTIHDVSSFTYAESYPLARRYYYQWLILNAIRKADLLITVSESTKSDLIKLFHVPVHKIRVIYNGVNENLRPIRIQTELDKIKQKYNLPDEYIFSLGVLEPKKNIERLILAYIELKKSHIDLPKLVVGGSRKYGWKNSRVFQLIKTHKLEQEVLFTDFIPYDDLPAVYSLARAFIFPSIYEGFGLPAVEAMACGTPVITSNVSSLPEIAGGAAILVNPFNVDEIANAILDVLKNDSKRTEMIDKGFENVKRFDWEKSANEILEITEDLYKK